MKIPNQEKVWDKVACEWKTFRIKPIEEATTFISNCDGNVLDFGCGSGRNFIKIPGRLYGLDFSKNQLKYAKGYAKKQKIKVIIKKGTAEKLPFKNEFFNKIISIATIHCINSDKKRKKALEEIFRVLKKDGGVLIAVWDKDQEKFKNQNKEILLSWKIDERAYKRYYYLYNKKEIIELMQKIGFKILKVLDKGNKETGYSKRNILIYTKKEDK